jgi:hypothetical protein
MRARPDTGDWRPATVFSVRPLVPSRIHLIFTANFFTWPLMFPKYLFTFILLVPSFCFAQSDFRSGFIITNDRDTVRGLINYREGDKSYAVCEYKRSSDQTTINYLPGQIHAYGFNDDRFFESRTINPKHDTIKTVFLEVIIRGAVSLYKYEYTWWIDKKGSELLELTNEKKIKYVNGKKMMTYTNRHIGVLNTAMFDCVEIRNQIGTITLTEKSLTRIVRRYNQCAGDAEKVFKEKKPWFKGAIGLAGGVNGSQLNTSSVNPLYRYAQGAYDSPVTPIGGLTLEGLSPRLSERISFTASVFYLSTKYYRYWDEADNIFRKRNYVTVGLEQIKVPVGIRYTFPGKKFMPYANAGMCVTAYLRSDASWVQEEEHNGVVTTRRGVPFFMKEQQIGVWTGFGVLRPINNKLTASLELRMERTDGIAAGDVVSRIFNVQAVAGVRIK